MDHPPSSSVWRDIIAGSLVALALVSFHLASYGDGLHTFFYLDDFWVMEMASRVHIRWPWDVVQLFVPSHLGFLLYRPLSTVTYFFALRETVGYVPTGYHAVQLGFHVVNAVLVYALARRLTLPRGAAAATSLIYAAAPGHALATRWVALFTVTGTACLYFLTLRVWLQRGWRWRVPVTWGLCVLAVLASELAVTLPVALLLTDVLLDGERDLWALARRHIPILLPIVAYVAVKAYLFQYLLPGSPRRAGFEGSLQAAYGITLDPTAIVRHLGHYLGWSVPFAYGVNLPALVTAVPAQQAWALRLGYLVLALTATTTGWAWLRPRAHPTLRLAAFGLALFVLTLAPVIVLRDHLFSFYVSVAAFGLALALVTGVRALPWIGDAAPLLLAAAVLVTHARWTMTAVRTERLASMYQAYSEEAVQWLWAIQLATADAAVDEVVVPRTGVTVNMFERSEAHRLFLCGRYRVRISDDLDGEPRPPGTIVLPRPTRVPDDTRRSWAWLRQACAAA